MLRKILPHVTIVMCNMYIVFYLIDRVNSAMAFINNGITKALLLVMCIISIVNSLYLIRDERRRINALKRRRAAASRTAERRVPAHAAAPVRTAPRGRR